MMLVSTSSAPAPYRNIVSARLSAKSSVLRAFASGPLAWTVGFAYGLPAKRSTMLIAWVGGASPCTRRRSMERAAALGRPPALMDVGVVGSASVDGWWITGKAEAAEPVFGIGPAGPSVMSSTVPLSCQWRRVPSWVQSTQ